MLNIYWRQACRTLPVAMALSVSLLAVSQAHAGFPDTGQQNLEVDRSDGSIIAWASGVAGFDRGPVDYQNPGLGDASFGTDTDPLGSSGTPFSLGDGGWITFTFDAPILNGAGADFVVFENAFEFGGLVFMELGFVEVSSDGALFSRMPALSRKAAPTGPFDGSDPADFYNLAGNFVGGTAFDLEDLITAGDPNVVGGQVDLTAITHIRVVDGVGDIVGPGATTDCLNRPVSDAYPTAFASGGFDATGVGVIHSVPSTSTESVSWGDVKSIFR